MKMLLLFLPSILSAQYMGAGALVNSRAVGGTTYGHCKLVSTSAGMVSGGSNLSNYPLTVNLAADNDLRTVGNGGFVNDANGYDVAFYSDCGGISGGGAQVAPSGTKLTWEMESYSASTGALTAHVLKTTLLAAGDSVGMWFYGTPTSFQSTATGVWSSAYKGVWHLNSTTVNDSTSNANNQVTNNGPTAGSGQIDGALTFNGTNQNIFLGTSSTMKPTTALTVSAWVNRNATTGAITGIFNGPENSTGGGGYILALATNVPKFYIDPDGLGSAFSTVTASGSISSGAWHYLTGTWDGAWMLLYIDGVVDGAGTAIATIGYGSTFFGSDIGAYAQYFPGNIDEIRLTNTALSADWIKTEYRNQVTNGCTGSPCVTVGSLQ